MPWPIVVICACAGLLAGALGTIFVKRITQDPKFFDFVLEARTIFVASLALVLLTVGLALVAPDKRDVVFFAFGGTLVGIVGAIATKASIDAAAGGSGLKGLWATIMTDKKPEPPTPTLPQVTPPIVPPVPPPPAGPPSTP